MQYRLRTLLIVLALGPPVLAEAVGEGQADEAPESRVFTNTNTSNLIYGHG